MWWNLHNSVSYFESTNFPDHVCLLHWPVHGLKQSPREWCTCKRTYLLEWGWEHMHTNYNIYAWHLLERVAILCLFVDDIPLLTTNKFTVLKATERLSAEFPITNKGPMTYFLGIEVVRNPKGRWIQLSMKKYITWNTCTSWNDTLLSHHWSSTWTKAKVITWILYIHLHR